ncbi:MAG: alpha-L-fucosidase [Pirellulaceae bacterium]|jgi:alpha-L-fucosidase|nr:alpha-L-fucosidase [Pirellulaceae bacterium]
MRHFARIITLVVALLGLGRDSASKALAQHPLVQPATGRTPVIAQWESLKYGMFIHFGLSTFMQEEYGKREEATCGEYQPTQLDTDQWARVAREAGMKYAVLTTKHCYGHCLWPSKHSDRTVAHGPVTDDVVSMFVASCRAQGIKPGFYYLLGWDNYHQPRMTPDQYEEFCRNQITELLTGYGPITLVWFDIPWDLGAGNSARLQRIYAQVKQHQPECLVLFNHSFWDGVGPRTFRVTWNYHRETLDERVMIWPTDIINGEMTPPPQDGHVPRIGISGTTYYIPMQTEDCLTEVWFHTGQNKPKSLEWCLNRYEEVVGRGANWLLDVAPDQTGRIPQDQVDALIELKRALDGRAQK